MGTRRRRLRKERNLRGRYYPHKVRLAWQKYEHTIEQKIAAGLDLSIIPEGEYCYTRFGACPYWDKNPNKPDQENGYCHLLEAGDWMPGMDLLWDQVKACPINNEWRRGGDPCLVSPGEMAELERVCREGFKNEYTYSREEGHCHFYRISRPGWQSEHFFGPDACVGFIDQLREMAAGRSTQKWQVYPLEKARAIRESLRSDTSVSKKEDPETG